MDKTDGRGVSRDVLEAYRYRAIKLRYSLGYSVRQISEIFGLNYFSVSHWFGKYRLQGKKSLRRRIAPGAPLTLDKEIMEWLTKVLVDPADKWGFTVPLWTGSMVRILLRKEKTIDLDRVTVWRYLRRMGLSFQKPETRYIQQNKELVKKWIRKEWPKINRWVNKNRAILYFEDESGISLSPVVGKTWAPKGKTPILRITGKRGGVLAMSAVSPSGRFRFRLQKGRINSGVIIRFLEQIMRSHKRRKIVVVMDQAPCHISKKVRAFVDARKNLKVFYIPPYSPELNPDEKVWRHLKHVSLKNHQAQNKHQLSRVVIAALRSIQKSPTLTSSFFDHYLV